MDFILQQKRNNKKRGGDRRQNCSPATERSFSLDELRKKLERFRDRSTSIYILVFSY